MVRWDSSALVEKDFVIFCFFSFLFDLVCYGYITLRSVVFYFPFFVVAVLYDYGRLEYVDQVGFSNIMADLIMLNSVGS